MMVKMLSLLISPQQRYIKLISDHFYFSWEMLPTKHYILKLIRKFHFIHSGLFIIGCWKWFKWFQMVRSWIAFQEKGRATNPSGEGDLHSWYAYQSSVHFLKNLRGLNLRLTPIAFMTLFRFTILFTSWSNMATNLLLMWMNSTRITMQTTWFRYDGFKHSTPPVFSFLQVLMIERSSSPTICKTSELNA